MKTIWKYPLEIKNTQSIDIPKGSNLLSVQTQNEVPCLWVFIHNSSAELETIKLRTIGTGLEITKEDFTPDNFIGTYQLENGRRVLHVFKAF